jgi:hypothetical protein
MPNPLILAEVLKGLTLEGWSAICSQIVTCYTTATVFIFRMFSHRMNPNNLSTNTKRF